MARRRRGFGAGSALYQPPLAIARFQRWKGSFHVDPILGHRAHRAPTRRKREAGQWASDVWRMQAKI